MKDTNSRTEMKLAAKRQTQSAKNPEKKTVRNALARPTISPDTRKKPQVGPRKSLSSGDTGKKPHVAAIRVPLTQLKSAKICGPNEVTVTGYGYG